jgi:hypothetical protein
VTVAEKIAASVAAVDADPDAGTRRASHTMQTRRVAAALRAIGLKRGEYSARVTTTRERHSRARIYGEAIGNARRKAGSALIEQHAQELAAAGFRVHLVGESGHFIASGHPGAVIDHRKLEASASATG